MYKIIFTQAAAKYLKKIKKNGLKKNFQKALEKISIDPYIGELKIKDLKGIYCYNIFYCKTNYELAYCIYEDIDQKVVVILAGTRENFYNELKRYWK